MKLSILICATKMRRGGSRDAEILSVTNFQKAVIEKKSSAEKII